MFPYINIFLCVIARQSTVLRRPYKTNFDLEQEGFSLIIPNSRENNLDIPSESSYINTIGGKTMGDIGVPSGEPEDVRMCC
jgi:hypothetical protein